MFRDFDAPREKRRVGDDDVIANFAVMAKMGERHKHDAVADDRVGILLCAAMDCDVFADAAVFADIDVANRRFIETDILWLVSDDGSRMDFRAVSDGGMARQIDVRPDLAVVADGDMFVNNGVRGDIHVVSNFRSWRDDGSWVNAHVW